MLVGLMVGWKAAVGQNTKFSPGQIVYICKMFNEGTVLTLL